MTFYQQMLVFYAIIAVISGIITWFFTRESIAIRLLGAILVGATWPISFPIALLLSLF